MRKKNVTGYVSVNCLGYKRKSPHGGKSNDQAS